MKFLTLLFFLGCILFPSIAQAIQEEVIKKAQLGVFGILLEGSDPNKPFLDRGDAKIQASAFHIGNGYVVTNHHAVSSEFKDPRDTVITFMRTNIVFVASNFIEYPARLVAHDKIYDLALYRMSGNPPKDALKFSEHEARMGESVFAVGYPLSSLWQKVSFGKVGNTDIWPRTAEIRHMELDMAACPGNSGGPLLNESGEVVGIVSSVIFEGGEDRCTHFTFAISSRYAKKVIDDFIRFGRARHALIGITMKYSKYDNKWLPAIETVKADGPAKRAGLQAGDIILSISGRQIWTTMDVKRIILEQTIAGENITLRIVRDGEERAITVIVAEKLNNEP